MSHLSVVPALPPVSVCPRDTDPGWSLLPVGLLPVGACSCSGATVCSSCLPSWSSDWHVVVHAVAADALPVARFVVVPDVDGWLAVVDLSGPGSVVVSSLSSCLAAALAATLNQPRDDGAAVGPAPVVPVLF